MECCSYTIGEYIKGKVRNINIPNEALYSILADVGLTPQMNFESIDTKERELSLAGLYVWIATSPTTSGRVTDRDADWEHTEGGEHMSAYTLNRFLRMANDIYRKYDMKEISINNWGMVGRGFHNIRSSHSNKRNL